MKVSTRLVIASTIQVLLLGVLLTYHVRTIRASAAAAHELTGISSRVYRTASEQVGRVAQIEENLAKHIVTRDSGYLAKFGELALAFEQDLAALERQQLSEPERAEVDALARHWYALRLSELRPATLAADPVTGLALLESAGIETLRTQTQRVSHAAYAAMLDQLARSDANARRAQRLSWLLAGLALLLSTIVAVSTVRTIGAGLERLTGGTREVARGRFGYRLPEHGADEFAEVARDFNTMTERLGEVDRMKRDFVSKVSHDLKTPLASMQETIRVLLDELPGPLLPAQRRMLELNRQSGERLYDMLAKLLELSRLEAGGVEPELRVLDVADTAAAVVASHAHEGSGVRVRLEATSPAIIVGDADRITQLLQNLVENALKFAGPAGVDVRVATRDGHVHIAVEDDGPGVPDTEKDMIFERFYQGAAGRATRSRGVGLGLTICREIVAMHGGTIDVRDRDGGGSTFRVRLPAAHAPADDGAAPRPADRTGDDTDRWRAA